MGAASLSFLDNLQPNSGFHRSSRTQLPRSEDIFPWKARRNLKIYFSIWLFALSSCSFISSLSLTRAAVRPQNELGSPNTRYWYKFHWIKLEMKAKRMEQKENTRNRSYSCAARESRRSLGKYSIKIVEMETEISSELTFFLPKNSNCAHR